MPHDGVISLCRTTGVSRCRTKRGSMRDGGPQEPAGPSRGTSSGHPGTTPRHRRPDPGPAAMRGSAADPRTVIPADPLTDPGPRSGDPRNDPRVGLHADPRGDPRVAPRADAPTDPRLR